MYIFLYGFNLKTMSIAHTYFHVYEHDALLPPVKFICTLSYLPNCPSKWAHVYTVGSLNHPYTELSRLILSDVFH